MAGSSEWKILTLFGQGYALVPAAASEMDVEYLPLDGTGAAS